VDLADTFTDHDDYVDDVTYHALKLKAQGYLLSSDADDIIRKAMQSDIGD
jgi:hypothetical protein